MIALGVSGPARAQDPSPLTAPGALPPAARLVGMRHEFQTWCNCGPVNITMALSYFGWPHDQQTAAAWLKPNELDKNVSPDQLATYVNQQQDQPGLRALWRYGGSLDTIKALIANDFPVVVESGFQPAGHEWMGHYMTVAAYDDTVETMWVFDSYEGLGPPPYGGVPHSYAEFDAWWRHFNRVFLVVYPAARETELLALLGPLADAQTAVQMAADTAAAEIRAGQDDRWGWFNAGTSAMAQGRWFDAARYFDEARLHRLPFRMLWYQFGPFAAYYHTGRYYDVLALVREVAAVTTELEELAYWRGMAYAALGRPADALSQFDAALRFNPNFAPVLEARALVQGGTYTPPAPLLDVTPLP